MEEDFEEEIEEREEIGERDFEEILGDWLEQQKEVKRINTFEENALLTRNKGIVVELDSGEVFQLTIVKN